MQKNGTIHAQFNGIAEAVVTECGVRAIAGNDTLKGGVYYAIWDTGAYQSCISPKVVEELGLETVAQIPNYTAGGMVMSTLHYVEMVLPNGVGAFKCLAACCPIGHLDILIGMDIIAQGDFHLENQNGNTVFTFKIENNKQ